VNPLSDREINPSSNALVEYTAYLDGVAGGIMGDLGLTLLDFQVYIAALRGEMDSRRHWADHD
jgi:hypothetical protein